MTAASNILSAREKEVLLWLIKGKANGDIGIILDISEYTVKNHVSAIMRKFNASNRQQVVAIALSISMIEY